MAEAKSSNTHPERLPGTWCVTLASDDDCRLAFNLRDRNAAESARAELAPKFLGKRLDIGFFPTQEHLDRWAVHEPVRVTNGSSVLYVRRGSHIDHSIESSTAKQRTVESSCLGSRTAEVET